MAKRGRPKGSKGISGYSPAIGEKICELISAGDSIREAARKLKLKEANIRLWRDSDPLFTAHYARAVMNRAEVFFERGNKICESVNSFETAQIARVQLDWIKWTASKLWPKQFGDRQAVELSGEVSVADAVREMRQRLEDGKKG